MPIDRKRARNYLKRFEFEPLFIQELGWDYYTGQNLQLSIEGKTYTLTPLVEKRGVIVYCCVPNERGRIPEYSTRRQIERQVAKYVHEHLIIYGDAAQTEQVWQWVRREIGKPTACREHRFHTSQPGTALLQKLEAIAFSLEEEESLSVAEVTGRTRRAFDVDRVTKKFYDRFKKEHAAFLQLIQGIDIPSDLEWYASLMLNRLMFIYFIQKQGFLDGDRDYLRRRLRMCQEQNGRDAFHSFYRRFLLRLCHEGLGHQGRTLELEKLLGKVPYLNGGLFEPHPLEVTHPNIQIKDAAFEKIFSFFEEYQWHLDERPVRNDQEINPDVLGYIFEKYTNQKQMGAYYTKEDITEYISKNCIIPFIFETADKQVGDSLFKPNSLAWKLLREDPDRYIYEAVRKGVDILLPDAITVGINDVSKRDGWNRPAAPEFALPTETWREHIARRTRCLEVRQKLASQGIQSINDLITYNLNIRQLAQDAIENCFDPELLWVFYQAISQITVLDCTCGSGAFLFAALNILEPLYDACLERMQAFLDEGYRFSDDKCDQIFQEFRQILEQVDLHPNRRYFILKSIVINNLYGVDIMQEATEICKLRLFLKLMAQVEPDASKPNYGIEPLPDIDFNIRAGNTLVGFASLNEVMSAIAKEADGQMKLVYDSSVTRRIEEKAQATDQTFQEFRNLQIGSRFDGGALNSKKTELRRRLDKLKAELDCHLADEYQGGQSKEPDVFKQWKETYQPFHWFVEFYSIVKRGGFDVIIGNPPYVEMHKIEDYKLLNYQTIDCGNIYPTCVERCSSLLQCSGRLGVIVPLSGFFTERMEPYQEHIYTRYRLLHISYYSGDAHPSVMFSGVKYRLSIILGSSSSDESKVHTSSYLRWYADEREYLFPTLTYIQCQNSEGFLRYAKTGNIVANQVLQKMLAVSPTLGAYLQRDGAGWINYHRSPVFWIRSMDFEPYFHSATRSRSLDHLKDLHLATKEQAKTVGAILNSTCFYYWFSVQGNCRNIAGPDITSFPIGKLNNKTIKALDEAFARLMDDLRANSKRRVYNYQHSGRVEYDEFYPSQSKNVIDEIDQVLARHYGFTDEELDFIINYDIKYRMGRDSEDED